MNTKLNAVPVTSERLGVSPATIWRGIKDGQIHAVRIGKRVLISDTEIARLMEEGTQKVVAA